MKKIDLREHLFNQTLLINPETVDQIINLGNFQIDDMSQEFERKMFGFLFGDRSNNTKPYRMVNNVAVIPVSGTLLHRVSFSGWGITGYDFIRSMFDAALGDPDVKGIAFDVNSGGGQVDGAFELADHIYANRDKKPSMSIVNSHAYSAAYLLASAAGQMSVPKTGGTGSIGVVTMHTDYSKALDENGINITFIHAGKHKVDGNPYEKLSASVRKRIQTRIDSSYDLFVSAVAKYRGLSEKEVRDTEAQTFSADESLSLNLVDAVSSPDEAMSAFVAEVGKVKEVRMTIQANVNVADQQASNEVKELVSKADVEAAKSEGYKAGSKDQLDRFVAVLTSEHYKGREELAHKMLGNGKLSADEINDMLSATQKVEKVEASGNPFDAAMQATGNPDISADVNQGASDDAAESSVSRILKNYGLASGKKFN